MILNERGLKRKRERDSLLRGESVPVMLMKFQIGKMVSSLAISKLNLIILF